MNRPTYIPCTTLADEHGTTARTIRDWAERMGMTVYERNVGGKPNYALRAEDALRLAQPATKRPPMKRDTPLPELPPVDWRAEMRRLCK